MKRVIQSLSAIALSSTLTLTSCTPYQQQGAGAGALGGAAIGAIAGRDTSSVVRGAAIGAAAGAGVAAYRENQRNNTGYRDQPSYDDRGYNDRYQRQPDYRPAPAPSQQNYPFAKRTSNPGIVISPYPPYNSIDISGLDRSDTLAKDTSAGKIFRIPR